MNVQSVSTCTFAWKQKCTSVCLSYAHYSMHESHIAVQPPASAINLFIFYAFVCEILDFFCRQTPNNSNSISSIFSWDSKFSYSVIIGFLLWQIYRIAHEYFNKIEWNTNCNTAIVYFSWIVSFKLSAVKPCQIVNGKSWNLDSCSVTNTDSVKKRIEIQYNQAIISILHQYQFHQLFSSPPFNSTVSLLSLS